jgi:hypothetical protein
MTHDLFHISGAAFLSVALLWCIFWALYLVVKPEFKDSIVLIIAANVSILITSALISTQPSLLHNEYHGTQIALGLPSMLINFFSLVGITLFRLSRQKIMNPSIEVKSMYTHCIVPLTFLVAIIEMHSHNVLTSINFSIVFDTVMLYLLYTMIVDIYECPNTTVLSKFGQALPLKLFIVNEIVHLYLLVNESGQKQAGDEIRLMMGYIAMLVIINLMLWYHMRCVTQPRRIRTDFSILGSV